MKLVTGCKIILILYMLLNVRLLTSSAQEKQLLHAVEDETSETISIYRINDSEPLLTQNAQANIRPFIHPLVAPDGKGVLTEYRPEHHTHQTGLYWGFKRVNGRDFFMDCCKPGQDGYHRKVSASVVEETGARVKWQTVYDLFDEDDNAMLTETHSWSMSEEDGMYIIDLEMKGEAKADITFGEFYVGGLFLRMPWRENIHGEVINASGQRNGEAEAQRSIWTDIGMQVDGREDMAHIAMLDHPGNNGFPVPWRVDSQLGVGPSRQILGDWTLNEGETEVIRYRLVVYTGDLHPAGLTRIWTDFSIEH